MDVQGVSEQPSQIKPLVLIPPVEMRRIACVSRTQEHYNLKGADPDWPKPVYRNGRRFYVQHEGWSYVQKLIARRAAEPPATPQTIGNGLAGLEAKDARICQACGAAFEVRRGRPPKNCPSCRGA